MIHAAAGNTTVPGVVVGVGSDVPDRTDPERFRRKFKIRRPFAIYIGRIDENKGCGELFSHFQRYAAAFPHGLDLVLVGSAILDSPEHPRIHHLGFLDDRDKFDGLAAADLLIMPSYYESLSMVALEAWAMGKPVLANAKCDVLQGQCLRSNAGLFYANYPEFAETMRAIDTTPSLQAALGRNGRAFFEKHYAWPVIEKKYVDMLNQLSKESPSRKMEPAPGWFTRRRKTQPPADDVVKKLPVGAYKEPADRSAGRQADRQSGSQAVRPPNTLGNRPPDHHRRPELSRPAQSARPQQAPRPPFDPSTSSGSPRAQSRGDSPSDRGPTGPLAQGKQQRQQRDSQQPGQRSQRPAGDRHRDQQRRGRPQRRGRRPGGGGGGPR